MFDGEGRQKVLTLATHTLRRSFVTGDWLQTFSATENSRSLHKFNELVGHIRVFNDLATPLEYFHLFYSDNVFAKIVDFTNGNAWNKFNRAEGDGILADMTFARGCCHSSQIEGLLYIASYS